MLIEDPRTGAKDTPKPLKEDLGDGLAAVFRSIDEQDDADGKPTKGASRL
jgi:hypothetical protein